MVILPSASMFLFVFFKQVSVEKFEWFDPNLIKNFQGTIPSRAPDSLWELLLRVIMV